MGITSNRKSFISSNILRARRSSFSLNHAGTIPAPLSRRDPLPLDGVRGHFLCFLDSERSYKMIKWFSHVYIQSKPSSLSFSISILVRSYSTCRFLLWNLIGANPPVRIYRRDRVIVSRIAIKSINSLRIDRTRLVRPKFNVDYQRVMIRYYIGRRESVLWYATISRELSLLTLEWHIDDTYKTKSCFIGFAGSVKILNVIYQF